MRRYTYNLFAGLGLGLVLGLWFRPCFAAALPTPRFFMPPGDLARAEIGAFRVTFMPNGAFVLAWQGRYLLDGGAGFSLTGWKRWGDQIRESGPSAARRFLPKRQGIEFEGYVFDTQHKPVFHCKEQVLGLPGGLRFNYELQALEGVSLIHVGVTLHWPVQYFIGQPVLFRPGFAAGRLGKKPKAVLLAPMVTTSYGLLYYQSKPFVAFLPRFPAASWKCMDDRMFHLNTARLWIREPPINRKLKKGQTYKISFDIVLLPLSHWSQIRQGKRTLWLGYAGAAHVSEGMTPLVQLGLCWRNKPADAWRYALVPPSRKTVAEQGRLRFEGRIGSLLGFETQGYAGEGGFALEWRAWGLKAGLPKEMAVWAFMPSSAKLLDTKKQGADREHKFLCFRIGNTKTEVDSGRPWSVTATTLWGTKGLLAVCPVPTQGLPTLWTKVRIRLTTAPPKKKPPKGHGK